jgi:adenosylcobyric acid synthase
MIDMGEKDIAGNRSRAKLLMVQGTGSSVGKSVLVAGLCRYFARQGVAVAPFKAQNMALNSFITPEGHEMGRAQVVQAEACGLTPNVHMNPVLIKPNSDVGAQVIVHGVPIGNMSAAAYHQYKEKAWEAVQKSFSFLQAGYELIIIEGAGSPAEINLRDHDIVNMGLATRVGAPVLLAGDIDKGGVFASLVGTMELLAPKERALIKGFVINKFRGDRRLLEPGLETISRRCRVPFVGVVPYFRDLYLPEEDGVAVEEYGRDSGPGRSSGAEKLLIAVIKLPHISNFTDFDPLGQETDVQLDYLQPEEDFSVYDLVIIPGSKNTLADLRQLIQAGFNRRLAAFAAAGGAVAGICGGYQMLGTLINDPHQVETSMGKIAGLGLLAVETELAPDKVTVQSVGELAADCWPAMAGIKVSGYEIHMGRTRLFTAARPLLRVAGSNAEADHHDGAVNDEGTVWGTYFHGIFDNDDFRRRYLNELKQRRFGERTEYLPTVSFAARKEKGLDALADLLVESLDMQAIITIIEHS